MSMKMIRQLEGSYSSKVELVQLGGKKYVLKTADVDDISNEKKFFEILAAKKLPTLKIHSSHELKSNQILLEYIPGSPTFLSHLSVAMCRKWGQLMRKINSIESESPAVLMGGKLQAIKWREFIKSRIDQGKKKHLEKKSTLPIVAIVKRLSVLLDYEPIKFGLLHGDAHSNNLLVKNNQLYIFDKNSTIFYGDALFDVALVVIEFPNKLYVRTARADHQNDAAYLNAFIDGYGYNFLQEQKNIIDLYVLLRAFTRYPNKFEPFLKKIIENIMAK